MSIIQTEGGQDQNQQTDVFETQAIHAIDPAITDLYTVEDKEKRLEAIFDEEFKRDK